MLCLYSDDDISAVDLSDSETEHLTSIDVDLKCCTVVQQQMFLDVLFGILLLPLQSILMTVLKASLEGIQVKFVCGHCVSVTGTKKG